MPIPVRIVGDHPHSGRTGRLVEVQKFKYGIMPPMGKVEFDEPNHEGEACYAKPENLREISDPCGATPNSSPRC